MKVERMRHTETPGRLASGGYCLMSCDGLQSDRHTSALEESTASVLRIHEDNLACPRLSPKVTKCSFMKPRTVDGLLTS